MTSACWTDQATAGISNAEDEGDDEDENGGDDGDVVEDDSVFGVTSAGVDDMDGDCVAEMIWSASNSNR